MFASARRPAPKAASGGSPAKPTATAPTAPQRFAPRPAPVAVSSPLSSLASSPPSPAQPLPPKPRIVTTTVVKTKTVVKKQEPDRPVKRTYNAAKLPEKDPPAAKRASGKGKARASSDEDSEAEEKRRPAKKKARPSSSSSSKPKAKRAPSSQKMAAQRSSSSTARASASSDLSSPSESDGESDLSSVDEDYFAHVTKREEGAAVAVRDVAAQGEGPMDVRSGESLVLSTPGVYVPYFYDPADPDRTTKDWAGSEVFTIELEYPAVGGKERFALLAPRSDDEYNPIEDVMRTVLTVLDHFLTPEQAHLHFGHLPGKTSFSAFLYNKTSSSSNSRSNTPKPGTPVPIPPRATDSPAPASAAPSAPLASTAPSSTTTTSAPASASTTAATESFLATAALCAAGASPPPSESLIRTLERARSKRDGPSFLSALQTYNSKILALKDAGVLRANIEGMKGLREKVWQKVFYQCYDRAVGPEIEELRRYEAFSDNVYGELLPSFMNEIFEKTHLGPGKVFVDLGSGVGNCVVQAALATGASAYGFENMPHASHLARLQVAEAEKRFQLWGLSGGPMSVVEADFVGNPEVEKVMRSADVVLVNNEVFSSDLNQRLSWLFLDLPASAKIISLKPFLPSHFKITSHNAHSPFAILSQSGPLRYKPGSVSWKMEGGTFFYSRVDRGRVERFHRGEREREEKRLRRARERREKSAASSEGAMSRAPSRGG
ncbi:hypothetical protein JCM10213_003188 [Rhodosporidiobolus nylandii]